MKFSAQTIATFLNGEIVGNPDVEVTDVSKIEEGRPGTLTFLSNPKYTKYIYETEASIVLVNKSFVPEKEISATLIKVDDSYQALAKLLELYQQSKPQKMGIESPSSISDKAVLGKDVYVGAFAYIAEGAKIGNDVKIYPQTYIGENVEIGDNTIIYAGVKIYNDCKIGKECVIHAGAVIGADGFGFAPGNENNYKKIPQIGNVILEDYVEIGANTCVDRATMGSTIVHKGVKLDNLIQIAHNVEVGENTVMASQTGIAGSTKIGANCMFGGQVGVSGHIVVANGVKLGAQCGVNSSITTENASLIGSPAMDYREFMKCFVLFRNFTKINQEIISLERDVKDMKEKLKS
jgi:UDP-3-O-[3-hydroxymyristoyl] glucosamine N-acyltransferase